jgi:Na+/H+ antiporter NhaC
VRKKLLFCLSIFFLVPIITLFANQKIEGSIFQDDLKINISQIIIKNVSTSIEIVFINSNDQKPLVNKEIEALINDSLYVLQFVNGKAEFEYKFKEKEIFTIEINDFIYTKAVNPIPLWMSVLPPLLAILMALVFREVYSALFFGLLVGTTIIYYFQGSYFITAIFQGLFAIVDTYLIKSLSDSGHLSIIIFSMLIGGMVNLITVNGGMKGVVQKLSKYANSPKSGQVITWLLGILIFFDDYANTLVVGNTMRPVTDRLRISREKLAYIVDSTAAPVASLALITTWIGVELSYIQDGIDKIGLTESAYSVFINSLDTRFYLIFTLIFILIIVFKNRDFGPMLKAEQNARNNGLSPDSKKLSSQNNEITVSNKIKARWYNAVIPVLVIIVGTIISLIYTGRKVAGPEADLMEIIAAADSYKALLWASILGALSAIILTVGQRILNLRIAVESLVNGFRTMLSAIIILVLAWSLALITEELHTSDFIAQSLSYIEISPFLLPAITFIFASLIAFSTGSSWGTMAILYPMILPAGWALSMEYGLDHDQSIAIFYNIVSSILAGSVFGDHCSPISDTTILSSLASSCNHIEHVRTQLPYALTVGLVSIFIGTIPAAYGVSSWILFPIGIIAMYIIIRVFGKKVDLETKT